MASPKKTDDDSAPRSVTDLPVFWIAVFSSFALAALVVMGPKYASRQLAKENRAKYGVKRFDQLAKKKTEFVDVDPSVPDADRIDHSLRPIILIISVIFAISWSKLILRIQRNAKERRKFEQQALRSNPDEQQDIQEDSA